MTSRGMTAAIETALADRYAAPEWALLLQVRNGTGFQRTVRTADAIAFSLYPSRGLHLYGFEIKASRGDWKKELKNPEKAEDIARFCNFWNVVAPKDVVPLDEVPADWGLIELSNGKLKCVKQATFHEAEHLTTLMLASIFRNISSGMIPRSSIQKKIDDAVAGAREEYARERSYEMQQLQRRVELVEEFEEASGIKINRWDAGRIGEAVKTLMRLKTVPGDYLSHLGNIQTGVRRIDTEVTEALEEIGKVLADAQPA